MGLHLRPKRVSQYGLVAEYRFNQRNLLKWSEDFSNAAWIKQTGCILTPNNVSPDNTLTAYRIQLSTNDYGVARLNSPVISGNKYTFSFYAKDVNSTNAKYKIFDATNNVEIFFESYLTKINKDSYTRVSKTFTAPSGCTLIHVYVLNVSTGADLYIWGVQLDLGTQATTYQKTTDLQVLRDYGRYGYHGQLGTGSGVDGSDPIPDGQSYIYDGVDDCVIVGDTGKSMYSLQIAFYVSAAISKSTTGKTLVNLETSPGGFVGMGSITGALTDEIITVGDSDGGRSGWCSATDSIAIGWHIIEVVWDGSKYNIYLDNVEKTITTAGTPRLISMSAVQLGRLITPGNYFAGKQSYLVLCDRSLSDEERAQNRATIKSKLKLRGVDATW